MKKIRIGNDIHFRWAIRRGVAPETWEDKTLHVRLYNSRHRPVKIDNLEFLDEGLISFVFRGRDQIITGYYDVVLVENDGEDDMATVDVHQVICLVKHTEDIGGIDNSNVETQYISLSSTIEVNDKGESGEGGGDSGMKTITFSLDASAETIFGILSQNGNGVFYGSKDGNLYSLDINKVGDHYCINYNTENTEEHIDVYADRKESWFVEYE